MDFKFTVDPDDRTLNFIAGDNDFWQAINKDYAPYVYDMSELNDILNDLLFNNKYVVGKKRGGFDAYYGYVIDINWAKLTLRGDTFNTLEQLNPEAQQAILSDIATAFVGNYQNIIDVINAQ